VTGPFPRPVPAIEPGTAAFESVPLVKPTGFREYDARWWFGHPASVIRENPEVGDYNHTI
jgi:phosphomannomutase / phosphoglucomutase